MEHLAKKIKQTIIFEKGIITEESHEIYQYGFQCFLELSVSTICSIIIALFLHMIQNVSSFSCFYPYAVIRRRLTYENIFCLFYRLLPDTFRYPAGSKICNNTRFCRFWIVHIYCHTHSDHRTS